MKTVRQIMSKGFLSVPPDLCLATLAQLLDRHEITGAPVIDAAGDMVGMVTQADIVRARARIAEAPEELLEPTFEELLVGDVMSPRVHSIEDDASVAQAARAMLELDVRRLVIHAEHGYVGIVTAGDLLRAWLPQDGPANLAALLSEKEGPRGKAA